MAFKVCDVDSSFDFEDACIRTVWAVIVPISIILAILLQAILRVLPYPTAVRVGWRKLTGPFEEFITLEEAETFLASQESSEREGWTPASHKPPVWKNALVSLASWIQTVAWFTLGVRAFLTGPSDEAKLGFPVPVLMAVPWLYSAIRPIARPFATVPYDIFALLFSHVFCTILRFGGMWYEHGAFDKPLPGPVVLAVWGLNVAAIVVSLAVVLSMPLNLPTKGVDPAMIVS
jgi:hypothetical protein